MHRLLVLVSLAACGATHSAPSTTPLAAAAAVGDVDHIGLTVTDLEASKRFFVDALGFRSKGSDPDYPAHFLTNDHVMVTLWRATDPATALPFDRKTHVGLHHLAFQVPSFEALDALYDRLREYPGVRIEFAPELAYGGPARHMMLYEPSGNRLEFKHTPAP